MSAHKKIHQTLSRQLFKNHPKRQFLIEQRKKINKMNKKVGKSIFEKIKNFLIKEFFP